MIASIIPEIKIPFNFDGVLLLIFISYLVYGYLSGGHKQIRLSINLVLPFVILYYMGPAITTYLYLPLSRTFLFELMEEAQFLDFGKNITMMVTAYLVTYFLLFFGIFILSIYAKRYVLNENMRAKLGIYNNYLGAGFSLLNGYVLIYFLILPAFSMNLVGTSSHLTNFVLEHPPPFSRIARTAEQAVPIKGLADKANDFQQLLSVEGIEGYYEDAIYSYQQEYVGASNSKEAIFMTTIYPELTDEAKNILDTAYFNAFDSALSSTNYYGISYILVQNYNTDTYIYEQVLEEEDNFNTVYQENQAIVDAYESSLDQYEIDLENYEYQLEYDQYLVELDDFLTALEAHVTAKVDALFMGTTYMDSFTEERPELDAVEPASYEPTDTTTPPVDPSTVDNTQLDAALTYVSQYEDKLDVRSDLQSMGEDFLAHKGLLVWYIEGLAEGQNFDPGSSDISTVIVSFKSSYDEIMADLDDPELQDKLYLAQMSIRSYDVFNLWLECTMEHMETVPLDEIPLDQNRCETFDTTAVVDYDFTGDAVSLVKTLFEGESVSWIITQYKYDYEDGLFEEPFEGFPEVTEVLDSTKELVDEYDENYKDIATSIEGNISMLLKIGISVMKYNLDVYETLENTPLIAAAFNDAARFCPGLEKVEGYDVEICQPSGDSGGTFGELLNMRYLISEIYLKAYFMVDENNDRITYDTETMQAFLDDVNESVENHVITREVVEDIADQFAFVVIDESNGMTLLEQMYDEGYISIEAMRVLSDDEYELFSDEFRARVRSMIR